MAYTGKLKVIYSVQHNGACKKKTEDFYFDTFVTGSSLRMALEDRLPEGGRLISFEVVGTPERQAGLIEKAHSRLLDALSTPHTSPDDIRVLLNVYERLSGNAPA